RFLLLASATLLCAANVPGQVVTGSMVGSLLDASGSAVAGASVTLTAAATKVSRSVTSDSEGNFVISAVQPGSYDLSASHTGFKTYERRTINLAPTERLSLGVIKLEVGSVSDSVTVQAVGAAVQSASGERSGIVTSTQVENL